MKKKSLQGLLGLLALLSAGLLSLAPSAEAQPPAPARVLLPLALSGWSQTQLSLPIVPGGSPVSSEEHFEQLRRGSIFVDFYAPNSAQALATMESREGQDRRPSRSGPTTALWRSTTI